MCNVEASKSALKSLTLSFDWKHASNIQFWSVDFDMCESDESATKAGGKTSSTSSASDWSSRILRRPPSIVWEGISGPGDIWLQTGPNTTTSISVTNTSIPVYSSHTQRYKNGDSALNSLECWDYSVELECLRGPDGMS